MNTVTSLVCLALMMTSCAAHLCLLNPVQRGGFTQTDIHKPGSDACFLVKGPCGDKAKQPALQEFQRGGNITVLFQKNLSHWLKVSPGYFGISIIAGNNTVEIARINDNGEPSLYIYVATGTLSKKIVPGFAVLQVVYVTKNSQAPAEFYQCADIIVL